MQRSLHPSRRAVLRGLGATLTLPFLPSLLRGAEAVAALQQAPRRFLAVTFGNGVHMDHWWIKNGARGFEFGPALEPLAPFASQLTPLKGLHIFDDSRDEGSSGHMYYFTNILSGAVVKSGTIGAGISVDQVMAREIGKNTEIPSLHLGIEPVKGGLIFGAPAICGSTISWRGPTTPVASEIYPQQVFDRLFNTGGHRADKSVLDYVLSDVKSVRGQLSSRDREKLDQYTDSVRELERRIARVDKADPNPNAWKPSIRQPSLNRPGDGIPASVPEHVKIMNELLVLALAMDKTRIATFVMAQDVTDRSYGFVEGVGNNGLHNLSHHGKDADKIRQFQLTNRWHTAQVADLITRMQQVQEGNGSLLDNTMFLFTATMDGDRHDPTSIMPLMIGGRNCGIKPGVMHEFTEEQDRRICNLHLSLLDRMGIKADKFGNSYRKMDSLEG